MTDDRSLPSSSDASTAPNHGPGERVPLGRPPKRSSAAPLSSVLWVEGELPLVLPAPLRAGLRRIRQWRRVVLLDADPSDGSP